MVVSKIEAEIFLNENVLVVHADGSSAGKLIYASDTAIILQKEDGRKTLVSLSAVEKIKNKEDL